VRAAVLVAVLCALPACSFHVSSAADGNGIGDDFGPPGDVPDLAMPGGGGPSDGLPVIYDLSGPPDLRPGGFLSVSSVSSTADVDLTAVGTADWVHWGTNLPADVDRKASGNNQISDVTRVDGAPLPSRSSTSPITFKWSDGLGTIGHNASSGGTDTSIFFTSGGLSITAPADKTRRRLLAYVGLYHSKAQMRITLSDGSADPYNDTMWQRDDDTALGIVYTIDYSAAGPGQTVTVTWTLNQSLGDFALVGIGSAALTTPP
jgi:hypothetical protein